MLMFFFIIMTVPLFWLWENRPGEAKSLVESRTLVDFPKRTISDFKEMAKAIIQLNFKTAFEDYTNRTYQSTIENAAGDQFPFRINAIKFKKAFDRFVIRSSYLFNNDPAIPADFLSKLYVTRDNLRIMGPPLRKKANSSIDQRIENYQELVDRYPELNFFVFYIEVLETSPNHPLNKYIHDSDKGRGFNYFKEKLPSEIVLGNYSANSYNAFYQDFYRTDHHWNIYGIIKGYETIYQMLSTRYKTISPPLETDNILNFPDIDFLGSRARETLYPIEPDDFSVLIYNVSPYEKYGQGELVNRDPLKKYLNGNYSLEMYWNYYGDYYSGNSAIIRYRFENDADRNLLIIGSSHANAIELMLAHHYENTYHVDLRHYKGFSLSDFTNDHEIDDVIIIGNYDVVYMPGTWTINP